MGGDIFQLVCLVDDDVRAVRYDFAVRAVADGGVCTQEMVIDDDDIRFRRTLPHACDEALLIARTFGPEAVFTRRGDLVPERQIFR